MKNYNNEGNSMPDVQNYSAVPAFGTDLDALNSTFSYGSRAGFPSLPTRETINNPEADLGLPRIATQLLEARDMGAHRDNELAMIQQTLLYSYPGIFAGDDIELSLKAADDVTTKLHNEYFRVYFRQQSMLALLRAFNQSPMMDSQWNNLVFVDDGSGGTTTITNSKSVGDLGSMNNDGSSNYGAYNITPQETNLLTIQTAALAAASFIVSYKSFMHQAHALSEKYPLYDGKISQLIGRMHRSAYTTIIKQVEDKLQDLPFDFKEWQSTVKPLSPASSRNDGSDDSLLVTVLNFVRFKPYKIGVVNSTGDNALPNTVKTITPSDITYDNDVYSVFMKYIFDDTQTSPDNVINGLVNRYIGWADKIQSWFIDDYIALEVAQRNGIPVNWEMGFRFDVDRRVTMAFDNYKKAYDMLTMSANGGSVWESTTQTYKQTIPYFRLQDGVMPPSYANQGFFKTWICHVANTDFSKTDSMIITRIMARQLVIFPFIGGKVSLEDSDGDGTPGTTLTYINVSVGDFNYEGYSISYNDSETLKASKISSKNSAKPVNIGDLGKDYHLASEMLMFLPKLLLWDNESTIGTGENAVKTNYTAIIHDPAVLMYVPSYAENIATYKNNFERNNTIIQLSNTVLGV